MRIALTFLGLLSICFSSFADTDLITGAKFSPTVRPQYKTSWCYAMAARTLLDQVICEATNSCGTELAPDVAVGGVISAQIDQRKRSGLKLNVKESQAWFGGGDQQQTLQEISQSGQIATGSCTQEKELFDFHRDPKFSPGFPLAMQLEIIFSGFEQSLNKMSAVDLDLGRAHQAREWLSNLSRSSGSKSILFLLPALAAAKSFDDFVNLTLLPPNCKNKMKTIPQYRVVFHSETNPTIIESLIDEGLVKKRLVSLSVCASKLSAEVGEECGGHAVVVSQSRTVCLKGKCKKEYRFLDSSFFPKTAKNSDGSYWLPKEFVIQATQAHTIYIKKIFKKFHDEFDSGMADSQSAYKKSILDYETSVINMKVTNQKSVDQLRLQIGKIREQFKKDLNLSDLQIAEAIKQNPNIALWFDDVAFEKMIQDKSNILADELEQMRLQSVDNLKNAKLKMNQLYASLKMNVATSSSNIIWLE